MPYVESRRSGIIVSPPSEMKVCLCLLTLHAGIARTRKRGALMRRPLSHSTMAGPITYFRDARVIEVTATESCTVWFVEKGKSHLLAAFFRQYESVIWLVFD